jgi:hypothetical protein
MSETMDYPIRKTWIDRARPEPHEGESVARLASYEASPAADPAQGWDPYDVWLRRVYLPRRKGVTP